MVLLEMAVEAVDGLGTCVFCVDVDVTFRGRPLFRSGATGEVSMSLKGIKAEGPSLFGMKLEVFLFFALLMGGKVTQTLSPGQ
ncbi:hypothetical protein TNCV_4389871 [Trichonephila clavipes]|nr:hypothetical protein TNCV_4389871 [Trichonephila clavipes]